MAVKPIPTRVCDEDGCDQVALPDPCFQCKRDVCYWHGAVWRAHVDTHPRGLPLAMTCCDRCIYALGAPPGEAPGDRMRLREDLRRSLGME